MPWAFLQTEDIIDALGFPTDRGHYRCPGLSYRQRTLKMPWAFLQTEDIIDALGFPTDRGHYRCPGLSYRQRTL